MRGQPFAVLAEYNPTVVWVGALLALVIFANLCPFSDNGLV